jgi:glycosyltransferase involved in cell wall biosynthesis
MARTEGFPNTLLEAMACAAPIVAGRLAQLEELLIDGENARLCAIDAAAVGDAIAALLADPAAAARMGQAARAVALAAGDLEQNGRKFAHALTDRLASRPPAPGGLTAFRAAWLGQRAAARVERIGRSRAGGR